MKYLILLFLFCVFSLTSFSSAALEYWPNGRAVYTHLCDWKDKKDENYADCLLTRDYFSQFEPLGWQSFKMDPQCYEKSAPEKYPLDLLLSWISNLVKNPYFSQPSSLDRIFQFLLATYHNTQDLALKCTLGGLFQEYFWSGPRSSKITVADINKAVTQYSLYARPEGYTPYEVFYSPLATPNILSDRHQVGIGSYLFSSALQSNRYRALRILKAWDTHWQEFAKISAKDISLIDFSNQALSIKNKKLLLSLTLLMPPQQIEQSKTEWEPSAIATFELQKDRSRTLVSCMKKSPKIWSSFCADQQISVRTLLDD